MHKKAVLFDLGRVLVNIYLTKGLLRAITGNGHNNDVDADAVFKKLVDVPLFKEYNSGKITPEQFHISMCELLNIEYSFNEFKDIWCNIFSMDKEIEKIVDEVTDSTRTGIISDTCPLHWEYIRTNFPVIQKIEQPTLSFQEKCMKPDPAIFLAAAEKLELEPSECIFFDDLEKNIEGAKAVGMHAYLFENPAGMKKVLIDHGILNA